MANQVSDIRFPLGGLSKRLGFQNQEPYTFTEGENVRPEDVFEKRLRGGSRPGLAKAFPDLLGSATGSPIRLLNSVRTGQELDQSSTMEDHFDDESLATEWGAWNPVSTVPSPVITFETSALPEEVDTYAFLDGSGSSSNRIFRATIRDTIAYNTSATIELEAELYLAGDRLRNLRSLNSDPEGTTWFMALGLQSAADFDAGGLIFWIEDTTGANQPYKVAVFNQSTAVLSLQEMPAVTGNIVRLVYNPVGTLQVFLGTASNLVYTVTDVTAILNGQIGFGIRNQNGASVDAGFDYMNFSYTPAATSTPIAEPALVVSANSSIYYETTGGTIAEASNETTDLASDRLLSSAEWLGKLYIADNGLRVEGTDGNTSAGDTTFDDDVPTNWVTAGVDTGDWLEVLSATGGDGTEVGSYAIGAVTTTTITLATAPFVGGLTAITYRIIRGTKVFDYRLADTLKLTVLTKTAGTTVNPPPGCTIAAIWQDRLVLSGDPENPGDVFMSKIGDPSNFTEDDTITSPVFSAFLSETRVNDPVTALIPFARDYLIIGSSDSIYALRGNPRSNARSDAISRVVGILDKHAWCVTPENVLVVMTGDGLYAIGPTASAIESVSRDKLPKDFLDLDSVNSDIQLAFDVRRNGIIISVTPKTSGTAMNYWFDWTTKGFFPESYITDQQPTAMVSYLPSGQSTSVVVFGSRDGYLRKHLESQATDDGTTLSSSILIGPLVLGGTGYSAGMMREIIGQLSESSDSVTCEIQVGDSIESARLATARSPFTLRAGKSLSNFPRLRGNACFLKISATGQWAYEQLSVVREKFGKQRLFR